MKPSVTFKDLTPDAKVLLEELIKLWFRETELGAGALSFSDGDEAQNTHFTTPSR